MTRQQARELLGSPSEILTPTGYRVAAMLCLHTNGVNDCWVGVDTLAAEVHASTRMVQKSLRLLEQRGVLVTQQRPGATSMYTILPLDAYTVEGRTPEFTPELQSSPEVRTHPTTLLGPSTPRPRSQASHAPAHAHAGEVVAAYDTALRANGKIPSSSAKSRIGREAKQLLADGYTVEAMVEPVKYIAAHGYNPSLLPVLVQDGIRTRKPNRITKAIEEAKQWKPKS